MKVTADFGECGNVGLTHIGTVKFDTTDIATGVKIGSLPKGILVLKWLCKVKTAFNAATTNVLTLGTSTDDDAYMAAADITEGTAGWYKTENIVDKTDDELDVYAKFTQTGTAATAGEAEFYALAVRIPE